MPATEIPQIAEDRPQRFLIAQQYMSLNAASAEAVAAAPGGFARHRPIARALADFALARSRAQNGAMRMLPAVDLRRTVALSRDSDPSGRRQHSAAAEAARSAPWSDLREVETLLRTARRAGIDGPARCAEAVRRVDFFDARRPPEDDAGVVDRMFPNPGSRQRCIKGRRLDIGLVCGRPQIRGRVTFRAGAGGQTRQDSAWPSFNLC